MRQARWDDKFTTGTLTISSKGTRVESSLDRRHFVAKIFLNCILFLLAWHFGRDASRLKVSNVLFQFGIYDILFLDDVNDDDDDVNDV